MAAGTDALAGVLEVATAGAESTSTEVTTQDTPTETTTTQNSEIQNTQEVRSEGTENTNTDPASGTEGTQDTSKPAPDKNITDALKSWKEASPEHAAIAKQLSEEHFRLRAFEQSFGNAREARELRMFLNEVTGTAKGQRATLQAVKDHWSGLQTFRQNVEDSDQLLYSGDPKVIENILGDLKEQNKLDALGKLAPKFIEALAANDAAGYGRIASSLISSELRSAGFVGTFNSAFKALQSGDVEAAKESLGTIARWFSQVEKLASDAKSPKVDLERQAFDKERAEFEKSKVTEFRTGVAREADKTDNVTLGSALKGYLRSPFFKDFPRPTLIDLAQSIKAELRSRLQGDKAYQTQMKTHWNAKSPDKAKLLEYHNTKVEAIAEEVVRTVVQRRYPQYSKGATAAAGRAAATQQKTATETATTQSSSETKPVYVAKKPDWNAIDWNADPRQLNYIAGKAKLKTGRWVTWRK